MRSIGFTEEVAVLVRGYRAAYGADAAKEAVAALTRQEGTAAQEVLNAAASILLTQDRHYTRQFGSGAARAEWPLL